MAQSQIPKAKLVTPEKSSEMEAMVSQLVSLHAALATDAEVVAAELYRWLPKARSRALDRWRFDRKAAAWAIRKALVAYVASNVAAQKAIRRMWALYCGTFGGGSASTAAGHFDLDG